MTAIPEGFAVFTFNAMRTADINDIDAIRNIADIAFRETYREILSPGQMEYMMEMMYSRESLIRQMTERGHTFILEEGKGYVSFRHDRLEEDGTRVFHLEKLYVLPEYQGTGLGRMLFFEVADRIRASADRASIELNVNRNNRAVGFYEHLGMRRQRSGDFPIGNGYFMNDYIMEYGI